jgi:hypothetical protein
MTLKPSAANKNKKGGKGLPCLSPGLPMGNSFVRLPFTGTDIRVDLRDFRYPASPFVIESHSSHHII